MKEERRYFIGGEEWVARTDEEWREYRERKREERDREYERKRVRPQWACCKAGRDRWFWVVWPTWDALYEQALALASGHAASEDEARAAARRAGGPAVEKLHHGAGQAASYRRQEVARRRATKTSERLESAALEFVYSHHWSEGGVQRHRIVKRTKTRVYVHKRAYRVGESAAVVEETFILDRARLESGQATPGHGRHAFYIEYYYATEEAVLAERSAARGQSIARPCFAALGLTEDCTLRDVRRSYRRLALVHHPDKGGDAVAFRELHAHYERACRLKAGAA